MAPLILKIGVMSRQIRESSKKEVRGARFGSTGKDG